MLPNEAVPGRSWEVTFAVHMNNCSVLLGRLHFVIPVLNLERPYVDCLKKQSVQKSTERQKCQHQFFLQTIYNLLIHINTNWWNTVVVQYVHILCRWRAGGGAYLAMGTWPGKPCLPPIYLTIETVHNIFVSGYFLHQTASPGTRKRTYLRFHFFLIFDYIETFQACLLGPQDVVWWKLTGDKNLMPLFL